MKKFISVLILSLLMISLCACGGAKTNEEENNGKVNVEENSSSLSMEKITAGNYTFMVPDNGDKKYSNGDTMQTFFTDDGETGIVWFSLEGPLDVPKNEDSALNITRSAGKIVKFEFDDGKGVEQATIINEYDGEYEGLRIVSNSNDPSDCIWLNVTGTDKKVIEKILKSLEW